LGEGQKSESTSREARGRRGLGSLKRCERGPLTGFQTKPILFKRAFRSADICS
jgi:hypothetical protein